MTIGPEFDDVLAAARAGGEWAWRRLYQDLAPVVLGYLRSHGARDPEDLLGEVFLRVARSLSDFEGDETGFRSWVFTIAHHRLVDERRKAGRRATEPTEDERIHAALPAVDHVEPDVVERASTEQIVALLEEALTEDQREVLVLRLVGGLTISEVADIVGRTENATKQLQRRGLRSLQRHLEEIGLDPYPFGPDARSQG